MRFLCHFGSKKGTKMDPKSDVESAFLSAPLPGASRDPFGDHFGSILVTFWGHFGTILGPCLMIYGTYFRHVFVALPRKHKRTNGHTYECFLSEYSFTIQKQTTAPSPFAFLLLCPPSAGKSGWPPASASSVVIEVGQHIFPPTAFSD
jgi:hypothetical protein